jgi:hypothetical protein
MGAVAAAAASWRLAGGSTPRCRPPGANWSIAFSVFLSPAPFCPTTSGALLAWRSALFFARFFFFSFVVLSTLFFPAFLRPFGIPPEPERTARSVYLGA